LKAPSTGIAVIAMDVFGGFHLVSLVVGAWYPQPGHT
jgi:hypothetical protein